MKKTGLYFSEEANSFSLEPAHQHANSLHCSSIKKVTNTITDFVVGFSIGTMKSLFSPFRFFKSDGNILIPN